MKKALCLLLALVLCLSLCACGDGDSTSQSEGNETSAQNAENTTPAETYYKIGDTVSTDIVEFSLDKAQLAIALSSVYDDTYCSPKDYDVNEDANNPFVCAKGHTYAAFTYTINNLDRTSYQGELPLVSAEYKNTKSNKQVDGAEYNKENNEWGKTGNNPVSPIYSWHFVLEVGEAKTFRSFIDIPVEADNLSDDFYLLIELPNSDGSTSIFTYLVM